MSEAKITPTRRLISDYFAKKRDGKLILTNYSLNSRTIPLGHCQCGLSGSYSVEVILGF